MLPPFEYSEATPPACQAPVALESTGSLVPAKNGQRSIQGAISIVLVLALGFIVISNYAGWTARIQVASVKRECSGAECPQRLRLQGSSRTFEVVTKAAVRPGDQVDVRGTCTPRCELEVTGVWPSAGGTRVAAATHRKKP